MKLIFKDGTSRFIDGEDITIDMLANLADIQPDGYDQYFVEHYHPNYNCDEIAWLDDACCALDNETSNCAHWDYLANCIVEEPWEGNACNALYDLEVEGISTEEEILAKMEKKFNSVEEFGAYLAEKYENDIQADINYYEDKIMADAIGGFKRKFKI